MSFIEKISEKRRKIIFGGILAVAAVHFAVQFSFIQSEKLRSIESVVEIENLESEDLAAETKEPDRQFTGMKPEEFEARKIKAAAISEKAQPLPRRQTEISQPQIKKKIIPETREARLRRAEKILTGV